MPEVGDNYGGGIVFAIDNELKCISIFGGISSTDDGDEATWTDHSASISQLVHNGQTDWIIPTTLDYIAISNQFGSTNIINSPVGIYWCSDEVDLNFAKAVEIDIANGAVPILKPYENKDNNYYYSMFIRKEQYD